MKKFHFQKRQRQDLKKAQLTIEYSIMFVVLVLAILAAARNLIGPSLGYLFNSTARVINASANEILNRF